MCFKLLTHKIWWSLDIGKVTNSYFKHQVIEPLVSHPCRLTGRTGPTRATPCVVTWRWPYTTGRCHPTWASRPYPTCGHNRRRSLPFLFLAVTHARPPLLCRMCHSARRGQPPPIHRRAIQPGQREHHDAVHLLHWVLAGSLPTEAEQPRFPRRRLPPWGAHHRPPLSKHLQPHHHFKKDCLSP
jgi:hypothetical protein